ncbi:MAG: hypothetical protein HZB56_10855 [Deltaproteobacteria bacterium]|nr:hypothetical protein [Deltaproteobacteria bacterium]
MKLHKSYQEFRNTRVFYPDPKNVDLDRVLVNLFLLFRCQGTRPVAPGPARPDLERAEFHRKKLAGRPHVKGFDEHAEVARSWLETDILDLVNRGRSNEAVASLRPLHLEAHKVRVAKYCRDYNHADALYAMLAHAERQALHDLEAYLDRGRSPATRQYDGSTKLDLETLTVLKLVEDISDRHPSTELVAPHPPVCIGQSRVLCDDVQRLLAYADVVPRPVMIEYLKALFGLHLGLFTLRVARQLPSWIREGAPSPECVDCPVSGGAETPFSGCPHVVRFTVDMGGDWRSRMARMAQADAVREFGRTAELVRAIFTVNQLLRYARENGATHVTGPAEAVTLLRDRPPDLDAVFKVTLANVVRDSTEGADGGDAQLPPEIEAIRSAGLPPFETFVELVTHIRQAHHLRYLTQMLDKLFQKNAPFGALVQGRSRANPRRWQLGGRLLELFVQLAVLRFDEVDGRKRYYTDTLLVDDLVAWIEARYGFVVAPRREALRTASAEEHRAFQGNVRAFRDRLREIGFYVDLSDAYIAQTVRPRYTLARAEVAP